MKITVKKLNNKCVVGIKVKHLDVSNMQNLKEELNSVLDDGNHKMIIDLSGIDFIDSSGLSVLIGLFKRMNRLDDAKLELCGLEEQPTDLLQITQLDKLFSIIDCV